MEKLYSVHDLVSFKIVNRSRLIDSIFPFWDTEIRDFESGEKGNLDFTVFLDKPGIPAPDCVNLDDRFYIKRDSLYCSDYHKYARWNLRLSGFESGSMEAKISANPFAWILISDLIINPLIWLKLNEKGYAIIHASGVVKDGMAYLFAGRGSAGKTTIAMYLAEKGFKLLGDHFVILGGGFSYSYLTPLHIADFNLSPFILQRMKPEHKIFYKIDHLLRKLTGFQVGTKLSLKHSFQDVVVDQAKLKSIFLVIPRGSFGVERLNKEELVARMVSGQKLESMTFNKYLMEYSYLFPESRLASYWCKYEENLVKALENIEECHMVEVPLKYDREILEKISHLVG